MEAIIPIVLMGGLYIISNQDKKEPFYPIEYPNCKGNNNYQIKETNEKEVPKQNNFESLSGEKININELSHNNMQPFFGSKVKQCVNENNVMNSHTGDNPYHIKKQEVAPLFHPEKSMNWNFGTPNKNDTLRDRINPSNIKNNEKPFEPVRVAPSLVKGTNTTEGFGGFNSGLIGRDFIMPKSVDNLRVKSNPKQSYESVMLGPKSNVSNLSTIGKIEKHTPDTYFINSPERYFTTTGIEKGNTSRPNHLLKNENRIFTTSEHYGNPEMYNGIYTKGKNEKPKRPELDPDLKHITNAYSNNNPVDIKNIKSYKNSIITTNRSTMNNDNTYGPISSTFKAMISPIVDILRPSKKDDLIHNIRSGNISTTVPNSKLFNPSDRTRTTIREMTENDSGHRFIGNQSSIQNPKSYYENQHIPVDQQRDTTNTSYTGIAASTPQSMVYDSAYNAHLIDKTSLLEGRNPTACNTAIFSGRENMNVNINKPDKTENTIYNAPKFMNTTLPIKELIGKSNDSLDQTQINDLRRNEPAVLNAYNDNPYTHSLNSY